MPESKVVARLYPAADLSQNIAFRADFGIALWIGHFDRQGARGCRVLHESLMPKVWSDCADLQRKSRHNLPLFPEKVEHRVSFLCYDMSVLVMENNATC